MDEKKAQRRIDKLVEERRELREQLEQAEGTITELGDKVQQVISEKQSLDRELERLKIVEVQFRTLYWVIQQQSVEQRVSLDEIDLSYSTYST